MATTTNEERLAAIERDVRAIRRLILELSIWSIDTMGILEDIKAQNDELRAAAADAQADAARGQALAQQLLGMLQDQGVAIASLQAQLASASPATLADLQAIKDASAAALAALADANITRDATDAQLGAAVSPPAP